MNQNRSVTSRSLLLSALLLPLVGVAQAALIATSAAAYAEPHTDSLTAVNGPTGSLSSAGAVGPLGVAGAQGYGEAAYGALHSSALAVDGGDGRARAGGSAASTDNVTLSSSFIGRAAIAHASFIISGGLSSRVGPTSTAAYANSTLGAAVTAGGISVFRLNAQLLTRQTGIDIDTVTWSGSAVASSTAGIARSYAFDIPFTIGTPFVLFISLNSEAQAFGVSGVDDASAFSNFGSTGYWGGISGVQLADGTVVSDFSVRSDSGFDWIHAAAVPEPGTYALMLVGLAVMGHAARRRRRAAAP